MTIFNLVMFYVICLIPTTILLPLFPYLTRKTICFGVSIPEEIYNDEEIKKFRKNYRNYSLLCILIIDALVLISIFTFSIEMSFIFIIAGTFAKLIPVNIFYLKSHFGIKALKAQKNWAADKPQILIVDTDFRKRKTVMSSLWFILYPVIILATLGVGFLVYGSLPDRLPMHYNIQGEVDRWANKSCSLLFSIPSVQALVGLLMAFVYIIIRKSKQQVDATNPEKSIEQNRVFRYRWSGFAIFSGIGLLLMFSLIQFTTLGLIPVQLIFPLVLLAPICMLAAAIVLSLTTGQGGSRVSVIQVEDKNGKPNKVISRDDDKHWKLGAFYYNPDDPSLFVEKRFGIGWDFNWARRLSWIILTGLLSIPVIIIVVVNILEK